MRRCRNRSRAWGNRAAMKAANSRPLAAQGFQLHETAERVSDVGVREGVALLGIHGLMPARLGSRPAPIVVCLGPGPDRGAQLSIRRLCGGIAVSHSPVILLRPMML